MSEHPSISLFRPNMRSGKIERWQLKLQTGPLQWKATWIDVFSWCVKFCLFGCRIDAVRSNQLNLWEHNLGRVFIANIALQHKVDFRHH